MNALLTLWLPILLSTVVVFIISSLVHMVFKWHASDYQGLANEESVRAALRATNPSPGRYVVPHCDNMKEMCGEAMQRKYREGPVAHLVIGPNVLPNMSKSLGQWFLWSLFIATSAACLTTHAVGVAPEQAHRAAQLFGSIIFVAHGFGTVTESIWMLRPWSSSAKYLLDAALYAIASGLVLLALWP